MLVISIQYLHSNIQTSVWPRQPDSRDWPSWHKINDCIYWCSFCGPQSPYLLTGEQALPWPLSFCSINENNGQEHAEGWVRVSLGEGWRWIWTGSPRCQGMEDPTSWGILLPDSLSHLRGGECHIRAWRWLLACTGAIYMTFQLFCKDNFSPRREKAQPSWVEALST